MTKVKAFISKNELLRITRDTYPNFEDCPDHVKVVVLIREVDIPKRGIIKRQIKSSKK